MRFWRRLAMLFQRRRVEEDLAEEMRLHLHLRAKQLERDGAASASSHREAQRQFGNALSLQDQSRDVWLFRWLDDLLQDFHFALRTSARRPAFAAAAIATIALGIGAATAVFSVVDAVLLQPLPYRDPNRMIVIWDRAQRDREGQTVASFEDFEAYRRGAKLVRDVSAAGLIRATLNDRGTRRKYLAGVVSAATFDVLGTAAALGTARLSGSEGCAVVVSHSFWTTALSADAAVIGRSIDLDGTACVVQAVMPGSFRFYPKRADMWFFLGHDPAGRQRLPYVVIFARLVDNATLAQAVTELRAIHASLHQRDNHGKDRVADADDAQRELTYLASATLRSTLVVLFGAVVALLCVASLNVGGLLLARFAHRQRELVVRTALGCGRGRMVRQMLAEGMTLSLPGAVLGMCLAVAVVLCLPWDRIGELPEGVTVSVNVPVAIFAVVVTGIAVLVSGLTPAWYGAKADLRASLGSAARGLVGIGDSLRMSRWMIMTQVAASFVVTTAAVVMADSVLHLETAPLGFRTENITTTHVDLANYGDPRARIQFQDALLGRLQGLPRVTAAAIGSFFPPYREDAMERLEVRDSDPKREAYDVLSCGVSPGYFDSLGTPLLNGRLFNDHDRQGAAPVAIVSASLAKEYFPDRDALGKEIRVEQFSRTSGWMNIVGVVADWKHLEWDARWANSRLVFQPLAQRADIEFDVGIQTRPGSADSGRTIREAILLLDGSIPSEAIHTLDSEVAEMRAYPRFRALIIISFALAGLVLTATGLQGTLHQIVSRRIPEFGLRRAAGAQSGDLIWLVMKQGGAPVLAGILAGVAAAALLARVLGSFFPGLSMADPGAMALGALSLLVVATCTIAFPARRAAKVDPVTALREE
jgi:predicted permease